MHISKVYSPPKSSEIYYIIINNIFIKISGDFKEFQGDFKGVSKGKSFDCAGIGICIFLKSISGLFHQNHISFII